MTKIIDEAPKDALKRKAQRIAEARNKKRLLAAIPAAGAKEMAAFILANADQMEEHGKRKDYDPDTLRDILLNENLEIHAQTVTAARKIVKSFAKDTDIVDVKMTGLKMRMADANRIYKDLMSNHTRREDGRNAARNAGHHGISFFKNALRLTSCLTAQPLKYAGLMTYDAYKSVANIIEVGLTRGFQMGRLSRGTLAGFTGFGLAAMAAMPIDATNYATLLGHTLTNADKAEACWDDRIWTGDRLTASFALAHYSNDDVKAMHYRSALQGLEYGVPPQVLLAISSFETAGFTDVVANNSSATNPYQIVDKTKFLYIRAHARNTTIYQEAAERIEAGTASDHDRNFIAAMDAVIAAAKTDLDNALESKKLTAPLYSALRFVDDPNFSAHLIALDIVKNAPELLSDNLAGKTPEEITAMTAKYYYKPHHFLGIPNNTRLDIMKRVAPNVSLTDRQSVAAALSPYYEDNTKAAQSLFGVVNRNPGILYHGITAAEAIPRISAHFTDRVTSVTNPIQVAYDSGENVFDLCVTNPEKLQQGPIMASYAEVGYRGVEQWVVSNLPVEELRTAWSYTRDLVAPQQMQGSAPPANQNLAQDGISKLIAAMN